MQLHVVMRGVCVAWVMWVGLVIAQSQQDPAAASPSPGHTSQPQDPLTTGAYGVTGTEVTAASPGGEEGVKDPTSPGMETTWGAEDDGDHTTPAAGTGAGTGVPPIPPGVCPEGCQCGVVGGGRVLRVRCGPEPQGGATDTNESASSRGDVGAGVSAGPGSEVGPGVVGAGAGAGRGRGDDGPSISALRLWVSAPPPPPPGLASLCALSNVTRIEFTASVDAALLNSTSCFSGRIERLTFAALNQSVWRSPAQLLTQAEIQKALAPRTLAIHNTFSGAFPQKSFALREAVCGLQTLDVSLNSFTAAGPFFIQGEDPPPSNLSVCTEGDTLRKLNASHNSISKLTWESGDVMLSVLEVLDLSYNRLTRSEGLFEASSPALTHLLLHHNALGSLRRSTFGGLGVVRVLDVSHNRIAHIDGGTFACFHFTRLRMLSLAANRLTALQPSTFGGLDNLRVLDLSKNSLQVLEGSAFVPTGGGAMEGLIAGSGPGLCDPAPAGGNDTSGAPDNTADTVGYHVHGLRADDPDNDTVAVFTWIHLNEVDLSWNNLTWIKNSVFHSPIAFAKKLLLGHNQLTNFPRYATERMPRLEYLDLKNNKIFWLDVGTFTSRTLKYINLAHNYIKKLISMTFLYLPNVEVIDLRQNEINFVYKMAFYRTCQHNQRFKVVLRGNKIHKNLLWSIFASFRHLKNSNCILDLDLKGNRITGFFGSTYTAARRHLRDGDFPYFEVWNHVRPIIADNPISCDCTLRNDVQLLKRVRHRFHDNMTRPEHLDLWEGVRCQAPDAVAGQLVEAVVARLDCQPDFDCPDHCACAMTHKHTLLVNCSGQRMTAFPSALPKLRMTVLLDGNYITVIDRLPDLSNVTSLDLSSNSISMITERGWKQLRRVRSVYLDNNLLDALPGNVQYTGRLRNLTLQGNPLACVCGNDWYIDWLQRQHKVVSDLHRVTCDTGEPVVALVARDLCLEEDLRALSDVTSSPLVIVIGIVLGAFVLVAVVISVVLLKCNPRFRVRLCRRWNWYRVHIEHEKKYDLVIVCNRDNQVWAAQHVEDKFTHNSLSTCLFSRDYAHVAETPELAADVLGDVVDTCKTCVVLLSHAFLTREWEDDAFRLCLLELLESWTCNFVFLVAQDVSLQENPALGALIARSPNCHVSDPHWLDELAAHCPQREAETDIEEVDAEQGVSDALMNRY